MVFISQSQLHPQVWFSGFQQLFVGTLFIGLWEFKICSNAAVQSVCRATVSNSRAHSLYTLLFKVSKGPAEVVPVRVWRCAWRRWWGPVQRCRPGNWSRNTSCCSSLGCRQTDRQHQKRETLKHLIISRGRREGAGCYLTSKRSSRAMKIPGMTMSPRPSMAKLLASRPLSSRSWGNTTAGGERGSHHHSLLQHITHGVWRQTLKWAFWFDSSSSDRLCPAETKNKHIFSKRRDDCSGDSCFHCPPDIWHLEGKIITTCSRSQPHTLTFDWCFEGLGNCYHDVGPKHLERRTQRIRPFPAGVQDFTQINICYVQALSKPDLKNESWLMTL